MSRFFRFFLIMAVFALIFAACSNSKKSSDNGKEGGNEFEGDGTEEFVTVGNSSRGDSSNGGDYSDDEAEADAGDAGEAAPGDDSGNAEREIVESDIYKFDGNVLWLANQYKGLIAVDIKDPENLKILDTVKFKGYVGEMYIQDGRAYVLVSYTNEKYDSGEIYYYDRTYSKLIVVDTSDPSDLSILGDFEMEGWIADSRQVGDVIYVASTEYRYSWSNCDGDYGTSGADQVSIMSVNIKDPKHIKQVDKVELEGYSYTFYVSQKSIYVAEADTYYWDEDYKEGYPITMFDISDPEGKIVKKAEFKTEGFMSDRWKMHEIGDKFFAVSSSSQWGNGDSFIESFDVSNPENVKRLDKLVFMTGQQLYGTKFEGNRAYAVTYRNQDPLHVIDISDPSNLKELGQLEVPGWSDFIEVRGNRLLAVGRDGNNSKISLYDVSDPEQPKEINTVKVGSNYSYSEANYDWKAFKIFDELGLILLPVTDYSNSTVYKLYLVDFDLDNGLKTRGFIESSSYIRRGVAIQDLIFSIGENHVVTADASDRDKPKILSELTLADFVYEIDKCGKFLCSLNNSKLITYDKNLNKLWESKSLKGYDDYYSMTILKNSKYAYIYNNNYYWWDDYEAVSDSDSGGSNGGNSPKIKIVKFTDNGKFEEIGDFPFSISEDYYYYYYDNELVVSENNVIAKRSTEESEYVDEDGYSYYHRKPTITFFDMNNPADGIKKTTLDFDYDNLRYENNIFVSGSTFWTSGCKLKKASENGDEYFCYAVPFDVSDPKNPKEGKRINIPGELAGISDDGKYFYTKTPEINKYEGCADEDGYPCWNDEENYDFYILKLNPGKTAVKVVRKEKMVFSYKYDAGNYEYVMDSPVVKNDKVFMVRSIYNTEWNACYYRNNEQFDITLISAETGENIGSKSFSDVFNYSIVKNGGFLVNTDEGLRYIDENGETKQVADNAEMNGAKISDSLFLDGKIYISAGWDGFYSFDVE